jgi:glutathione S-transferase
MHTLIGVFDSPFVRRVAITMRLYGIEFRHEPLSVYRHADAFAQRNPMIKAPTLLLPDGDLLVDSAAMLDYLDESVAAERRLTPPAGIDRRRVLNLAAIACIACEKAAQRWSEVAMRPQALHHEPAIERCHVQMIAALQTLEARLPEQGYLLDRLTQADVTATVALRFIESMWVQELTELALPRLRRLAAHCEALPVFRDTAADA